MSIIQLLPERYGDRIAGILERQGVRHLFTLCGGHISPILVGAKKLGIENVRDKMVGRGVLLDIARWKGVDSLEDGYPITNADLDGCAAAQGVEIRKGDFVIVRTGHQERCLASGDWSGYAGGDAPGLAFETAYWIKKHDIDIKSIKNGK